MSKVKDIIAKKEQERLEAERNAKEALLSGGTPSKNKFTEPEPEKSQVDVPEEENGVKEEVHELKDPEVNEVVTPSDEDDDKQDEIITEAPTGNIDNLINLLSQKKPTMNETHTRVTYLIKNELVEDINKLLDPMGHGAKTKWINNVLERAVDELKLASKQLKKQMKKKK